MTSIDGVCCQPMTLEAVAIFGRACAVESSGYYAPNCRFHKFVERNGIPCAIVEHPSGNVEIHEMGPYGIKFTDYLER